MILHHRAHANLRRASWVDSLDVRLTSTMFAVIAVDSLDASCTLRPISFVVAVCSSTAEAIVDCVSLMRAMIPEIWEIAATEACVST